jgi:ubiquinone/menaquinone biosynthesis C-methylase UbiE
MTEDETTIVERERRFHNERFLRDTESPSGGKDWWGAIWHETERQKEMLRTSARGKDVLEYGCGDGSFSLLALKLPAISASLTGIDISDVAIGKAAARPAQLGYQNARFREMNAEAMSFPDESFDVVFGRAIIHHLDLEKSFSEVARVLRKDGVAIFSEPLGHNPLINLYRRRTPTVRTVDEHPLRMEDFTLARRYFARIDTCFHGMFTVMIVFLGLTAVGRPWRLAKAIDDVVLRSPAIGRYAWNCLFVCRKTYEVE